MDFSGVADIQFKLICIKRRVLGISYGTPTWSSNGWYSDGTGAYIDPLYDTTSDSKWLLNNAGVSWVNFQVTGSGSITGGFDGTADTNTNIVPKTGTMYINGSSATFSNYAKIGFTSVNRISATEIVKDGVTLASNSTAKFSGKLLIGARNRVDISSMDSFYLGGISFICMGGAALDYTAMKTILEP